jgi:hypothetical protein
VLPDQVAWTCCNTVDIAGLVDDPYSGLIYEDREGFFNPL